MKPRVSLTGKILCCVLLNSALLCLAAYAVMRAETYSGIDSNLLAPTFSRLRVLAESLSRDLRAQPASQANRIVNELERKTGLSLGVYQSAGARLAGSASPLPESVSRELTRAPKVFFLRAGEPELFWFGIRVPVGSRETAPVPGALIVSSSSLFTNPALFDSRPWVTGLAAMALCTLFCWVPMIRYLSRSFREVLKATERLAEGHFDSKLEAGGHGDEIAQLSAALNRVSRQLEGFVAGQKRFLGDIAHELTAPIARTNAAVGVLELGSAGGALPYLARVSEEIGQMSALVNELLHFSKAGLRQDPSPLIPQCVAEVVETIIQRESAQARVVLAETGNLTVLAQPDGLCRALSNLVRNAVRYASDAGPVTISARRRGSMVEILVADEGPGIPEELLERVFTPFYRLDSSRSRTTGGSGLGLAIVKACVEASGGTVRCRNRTPRGLEAIVTLNAAEPACEERENAALAPR